MTDPIIDHEGRIASLESELKAVREIVESVKKDSAALVAAFEQAKGAKRMITSLAAVAAFFGSLGGVFAWLGHIVLRTVP